MDSMLVFITSYLLGSIPFGLILAKLFNLGDVRQIGSGNIGATNVLRTGSKKIAAATLILDMLKGAIPVFFVVDTQNPSWILLAGLGAFIGHVFPVWLKFNGGKGVATYLGILLGLSLPLFGIAIGIWILIASVLGYSSMAALVTAVVITFISYDVWGISLVFVLLVLLCIGLILTHTKNILRISKGTEPRIGQKTRAPK